jgi:hypothetical protein
MRQRSTDSQPLMSAPAPSGFHRLHSLLRLPRELGRFSSIGREAQPTAACPWLHSAWNERGRLTFQCQALRRDAVGCPLSEACWISKLRDIGYAGLRDAQLNARHPGPQLAPRLRRFLQADPEELRHPRRQIVGGNVTSHVEQLQAEERHDLVDDYD